MVWCNRCGQEIFFDKTVRSASGKMIPLDPDREKHNHDPNDPNEPLNKKWTRNPNFVKPLTTQQSDQYQSSNNFRIKQQPQQQQSQLIPKGQFEQRGGESEYRRPIDDLLNQHHNALTQMYNNINNRIDTLLNKINEEAEKNKELWRIVDATAATLGVYKTHSALDEWKNKQREKLETDLERQQKQAEQDVIDEEFSDDIDESIVEEEKIVTEVGE